MLKTNNVPHNNKNEMAAAAGLSRTTKPSSIDLNGRFRGFDRRHIHDTLLESLKQKFR